MIWILLTVAATAALLVADRGHNKTAARLFKPAASAGFVGLAIASGATDNPYGATILVALVLCFIGDICLLSSATRWFLAGLIAFALGHAGYILAFWKFAPSLPRVAIYVAVLAVPALVVHRWLHPHVERGMQLPVKAYMAIITLMLATAAAVAFAGAPLRILLGATLFYLSDLAVARDRFVAPGFGNRVWGLPAYYAAQLILASSVAL